MENLFPASFGASLVLIVVQTYLLLYFSLLLLQRLKLLKKPYGGMEYSEAIPAAVILMGVLVISSGSVADLFQTAQSYRGSDHAAGEPLLWFFARSFMITLLFSLLFIILNYLNIRYLFRGYWQEPVLTISILLSAISGGMLVVCWFLCKEIIDSITPKLIDFR